MNRLHPIVGAISAQIMKSYQHGEPAHRQPFITISREAGAGGGALAEGLVQRLRQIDRADPPWTAFDKNLTEKVAADYHMSKRLIESIEDSSYNWLREAFENILSDPGPLLPDDVIAYRRVAKTMWALAHGGRVVLVGRGGVFVTESLPKGIHVRLVAPLAARVERIAKERGLRESEAKREVEQLDEKRRTFYERFWPHRTLEPEHFTVTYNTAALDEEHIAESILPLLKESETTQTKVKRQLVMHNPAV